MNIYEFAPVQVLLSAASWVVTALGDLLEPVAGGAASALAVVILTLLVRVALIPVGVSQARAAVTRERLAPKIAELRRRYAKRPEELQRRLMELYAQEKASPLQGCLPVLAQAPVLLAVYGIFAHPAIGDAPNDLLAHDLLGVGLGDALASQLVTGTVTIGSGAVFGALMIVIAVVAQLSRRLLPIVPPAPAGDGPDLSGVFRAMTLLPFVTAVVAAFVPLAAAVYLATTTTWTLAERLVLKRLIHP
ncbi:YidC/Oxa1 family membrane protein insertase [Microbacterium album]|uniref:Membrane protein insertase YidC n=1 Tax=Microbacterium album TaxID=2053191 RepID=A0A917ML09_9MICO|nr:membrane protein insertase YidC [Microbacterium album]GGH35358.1 membrane protein [Microbacterium album]